MSGALAGLLLLAPTAWLPLRGLQAPAHSRRCAATRAAPVRMEVFVVTGQQQLEGVMDEYRRADGVVVLYFTEAIHELPNDEFERLAGQYKQQSPSVRDRPVIFIQVTRDDPMQAVLCSQRGVTALPQVEVWRDGARRSCLDGLSGVLRLPDVLSELGVRISSGAGRMTGGGGGEPPTRSDGTPWTQW